MSTLASPGTQVPFCGEITATVEGDIRLVTRVGTVYELDAWQHRYYRVTQVGAKTIRQRVSRLEFWRLYNAVEQELNQLNRARG